MSGRMFALLSCLGLLLSSGCSKQPPAAPVAQAPATPPPAATASLKSGERQPAEATEVAKVVTLEPAPAETPAGPAEPPAPKEMLREAGKGVVLVKVFDALGEDGGFGSGCYIGDGLFLTNYHVIESAVTAQVQLRGEGDEVLGAAFPVSGYRALDPANDLAVLSVAGLPDTLHVFKIADADRVEQFDKVYAIGHPDGLKFSTTPGFVNALVKSSDLPEQFQSHLRSPDTAWIETDAVISGGSSGGPLINEWGEVVGINTMRAGNRIALAVRSGHVHELLKHLSESTAALPVPDSNVLTTRAVAEIQRGYVREYQQFTQDLQQAQAAKDLKKVAELVRRNYPGPACLLRCQELVREYRGKPEAEDALRLCSYILSAGGRQFGGGRHYLDELLDEAARDPNVLPPTVGLVGSLYGLSYSPELERYLRSIIASEAPNNARAAAGLVLVAAMSAAGQEACLPELTELARSTCDLYGDEVIHGQPIRKFLEPIVAASAFAVGGQAPEITGKDGEDKEFKLSEYRGKVVVLDFWADWCPHCRNMYGEERDMVERLKDQPFALLGVNCDEADRARSVIGTDKITWRTWVDGPAGPIAEQYQVGSFPTVFVLDKDGYIRYRDVPAEELAAVVDSLLNDTPYPFQQDLVAANAEWRYHAVADGAALAGWNEASFDAAAWSVGQGPFGARQGNTRLEQPEPGKRPLTTLFRSSFDLPEGKTPAGVLLRIRYRDGVAVSVNGNEVYRDRLTSTAALNDGALSRAGESEADGVAVSIDPALLKPTGNTVAVELHQFSSHSVQPLFELTLGTAPDLPTLMKDATTVQQLEICQLITQAQGLNGAADIVKSLQKSKEPELQLHAAIAAAANDLPMTVKRIQDEYAQMSLVRTVYSLNETAWEVAIRDNLTTAQYDTARRMARTAYTLLPLVPKEMDQAVAGTINTYGVALYRVGDYELAEKMLNQSIVKRGDNPVDAAYMALTLQKQGKTDAAKSQRDHALKMIADDEWKHDRAARDAGRELEATAQNQ